ncbi:hypothetical protein MtrunA17_Chr7g0250041 [Medicago truncatula]|uniref:Uncharacterized protein n=1 Tax=Medicago truncatula TaxID=3880 RepID=A0A396H1Q4_MEDTR|nr:hypothetical protein MtrunA17_Chr7g0250041 [Medicago truncatula]
MEGRNCHLERIPVNPQENQVEVEHTKLEQYALNAQKKEARHHRKRTSMTIGVARKI